MPLFGSTLESSIKSAEAIVRRPGGSSDERTVLFCNRFLEAVRSGKSKYNAYEEAQRLQDIDDFLATATERRYVEEEVEEEVAPPSPTGEWRRENPRWRSGPKEKKKSVVSRPIPGLHLDRAKVREVLREFPDDSDWSHPPLLRDEDDD